jgi:hypothetical protein
MPPPGTRTRKTGSSHRSSAGDGGRASGGGAGGPQAGRRRLPCHRRAAGGGFLITGGRRLPRLLRRRWLVAAPDGSHRLEIVTFERPKFESTETLTSFASLICVFSIGDNMRIAKWVHERELAGSRVGRRSGSGVRGTGSASMGRAPAGVVAQRT